MTKVAAIVGPTAAGKTKLSLEVAETLGAEIVSLDSMQIYRGMDVGTDKLAPARRRGITHHLLDVVDPSREMTVAEFQDAARAAIDDITARGRLPLLVGGSGLYFRAVIDDLRFPPTDASVRRDLERVAESEGADSLYARLERVDPAAAARIEPGNARRIVRALEVIEVTGRPFSENRAWDDFDSIYEVAVAGVALPRPVLYERIEQRVDAMLAGGLIEEARRLQHGMSRVAGQALGYRQVLDAPSGASPGEIRDAIATATKRFARRQESWFRGDPRIRWFDGTATSLSEAVTAFFRAALGLALGG